MRALAFQQETHHIQRVFQRLCQYSQQLTSYRRRLLNIAVVFRRDPRLSPMQCSAAIKHLEAITSCARQCQTFLNDLDPQITKLMRPYGCIEKLKKLEEQVTETILALAMFESICQAITYERVELHMLIRSQFPPIIASYEDAASQLMAQFVVEGKHGQAGALCPRTHGEEAQQ